MSFQHAASPNSDSGSLSPPDVAPPPARRRAGGGVAAATVWGPLSPPGLAALGFAVCALLAAACATTRPPTANAPADPAPAARSDVAAEHARGKELYDRKCGTCHELYSPEEYTREQWTDAVRKYGPRSNLARADRPAVIAYLHAYAADSR